MPHWSLGSASYLVTFIDDATKKVWAYPIKMKDHAFTIFQEWLMMVETNQTRSWNAWDQIMVENSNWKISLDFPKYATSDESLWPHTILSKTKLVKEWIVHDATCRTDNWFMGISATHYHAHNQYVTSRPLGLQILQELWPNQSQPNYEKLQNFGKHSPLWQKEDHRGRENVFSLVIRRQI